MRSVYTSVQSKLKYPVCGEREEHDERKEYELTVHLLHKSRIAATTSGVTLREVVAIVRVRTIVAMTIMHMNAGLALGM